jgi:uncharacterized protein YaaQ
MKMVIAIIRDVDREPISQALISSEFRVTRIASTGGFMRRGSTTLMVGVEDEMLKQALEIIKSNLTPPTEQKVHRATLFVLDVEHFVQI